MTNNPAAMTRAVLGRSILLLALGACAGTARLGPRFEAIGPEAGGAGEAVVSVRGLRLEVRELGAAERGRWLSERTGAGADPFAVTRDGVPWFRTFLLAADNGGPDAASINPGFIVARVGQDRFYPLGYSELHALVAAVVTDPASHDRMARLLGETATALDPGERGDWLLVLREVPDDAGELRFEIGGIQVGRESAGVGLRFRRPRQP
jgi:hypothetical protein